MIYTKKNQRLTIDYDTDSESPREWSNLGYFITCDNKYNSPDDLEPLVEVIKKAGDKAISQIDHIKMIKNRFNNETVLEEIIAIFPIVKFEHGNVNYSLGSKHGFDYSNNGFYIITDKTQKELGVKPKDFKKVIKQELKMYNKYVNGEVYSFTLEEKQPDNICKTCQHNSGGKYEQIDAVCNFYSVNDIFDHIGENEKDWKELE